MPAHQSPAVPRPAASLLVVRRAPEGQAPPQLLMGRRAASHKFMPNLLVFPGGAVDATDDTAPVATPLAPQTARLLQQEAPQQPALAHALAHAAARELQEEVGLSLGTPPALHPLIYLCRAITPPDRTIRFDARFFLVDACHVSGTPTASPEIEQPGWYTVAQALNAEIPHATRAILALCTDRLQNITQHTEIPVLLNRQWLLTHPDSAQNTQIC